MSDQDNNRRKSQRIELDESESASVAVETPGGSSLDGRIADFSIDGIALCFQGSDVPPLFTGQKVTITLRVPMSSQEYSVVDITAEVRNFVHDPASEISRCGLKFDYTTRRDSVLFRALSTIANQRNAARIEPDNDEPVTIALKTPEGIQSEGKITDISASGVGIVISGKLEDSNLGLDTIGLSFSLPDDEEDVDLSGTIRHRKLDFESTWVGIEFDHEEETRTDMEQKKILRYIMKRQRELLNK